MISIQQITLPITHSEKDLQNKIAEILWLKEVLEFVITKRAIDSRKKNQMIFYVYSVTIEIENEEEVLKNKSVKQHTKHHRIEIKEPYIYEIPKVWKEKKVRPIIVWTGPSGLFSALILSKAGLKPLVIERGEDVDSRVETVQEFSDNWKLNTESNIQFWEGGAWTFSDWKLNTLITNPKIKYIFNELVKAGAPEEILWNAKPHIGTDKLRDAVKNIRKEIIENWWEIRFNTKLTDIKIKDNKIESVILNSKEEIKTNELVLAIGHSARDTYKMLFDKKLDIEQKPFSIWVRIEHKSEMINYVQYKNFYKDLCPASYKLVSHSEKNRSVYTFCMCPWGYVMPSSSQEWCLVTNGMSEFKQDWENSNSALLVNVGPKDFDSDHPLAWIEFQEKWEKKAFELWGSNYHAPVQLVWDFLSKRTSEKIKTTNPSYKPGIKLVSLDDCLPDFVAKSLREAIPKMNNKISGFSSPAAVLTWVETRSSSPVRIIRDKETLQSNILWIYPTGEGAGYAWGIISSAVDWLRVGEAIINCEL